MEAIFSIDGGAVRIASLYLPNGNPIGTDKFKYKLAWMERLQRHAESRLRLEEPFVLAGDYNVIPEPRDARHPELWTGDALYQPESRDVFNRLVNLGFTDAVRAVTDDTVYTFWDYQAGAWQKNNGIRIDHALLSPEAARCLGGVRIDKHVRAWEKPSDHVPVVVTLNL
jgi:exodeoxyribonuclease-3